MRDQNIVANAFFVEAANSARPVPRFDWLDALRGWAVLAVVLVHAGQLIPGLTSAPKAVAEAGQYGVQLFFIVSALTIFRTYGQELRKVGNVSLATTTWLLKRFFRIAPLYYYGIALYFLGFAAMRAGGSTSMPTYSVSDIVANILFIHAWIPSAQGSVVPGGWSIGVEMFFYLATPLIFLVTRTPRACGALLLGSLALAELLGRGFAHSSGISGSVENDSYLYFWFPTQLPVFLAGVTLLAVGGNRLWAERRIPFEFDVLFVCAFILLFAGGLYAGTRGQHDHVLAPTLMGAAFCFLVLVAKGQLAPLLVNGVSVQLGKLSYSIYINHFLMLFVMRVVGKATHIWSILPPLLALAVLFVSALILTVGLSLVTQRFIEAPGIEFGKWASARIRAKVATATPMAPAG